MDTLRVEPARDLVHLGLMDEGPDGKRPEVDGETLRITLPLSQFEGIMDRLKVGFRSPAYVRFCKGRSGAAAE